MTSLNAKQTEYARVILGEVERRGLPKRAGVIAIEVALTESRLVVYANSNVPESMNLPHEAVGHDHRSVGIFQQQVPMWGTAEECMDPLISTQKFLNVLQQSGWGVVPNWTACQNVQHSAFSDGSNYAANDAEAQRITDQLWEGTNWALRMVVHLPHLRRGCKDKGTDLYVKAVQALCNIGQRPSWTGGNIDVDGDFGPATERAIIKLQAHWGDAQDGIVGPNTWRDLIMAGDGLPTLSQGSKDTGVLLHVTIVQTLCALPPRPSFIGATIKADGDFGPATERAIIKLQAHWGRGQDGIVGPSTWSGLMVAPL